MTFHVPTSVAGNADPTDTVVVEVSAGAVTVVVIGVVPVDAEEPLEHPPIPNTATSTSDPTRTLIVVVSPSDAKFSPVMVPRASSVGQLNADTQLDHAGKGDLQPADRRTLR